jgi:hypothetical protein
MSHETTRARNKAGLFRVFVFSWLLIANAKLMPAAPQQTFTGTLSDSACAASHQSKAAEHGLTDRQCVLACIDALAKYVLVDRDDKVIPIANQDVKGLPFYAGRGVKLTGEWRGNAVLVTKVEAVPVE